MYEYKFYVCWALRYSLTVYTAIREARVQVLVRPTLKIAENSIFNLHVRKAVLEYYLYEMKIPSKPIWLEIYQEAQHKFFLQPIENVFSI